MDQLHLKVLDIKYETDNAATFYLADVTGKAIRYEAGQFLTFLFGQASHDLRRSYSFSSTPDVDKIPTVTLKRIDNGAVSRFFFDHLRKGDELHALPPSGRFTVSSGPGFKRQFIFIAAGTGISPVYSLLKKILHEEPLSRILLIYQNHDEKHVIFKEQILNLTRVNPEKLTWINLLSAPLDHSILPARLTNFLLEQLISYHVDRSRDSLFFLCGPPSFMRMSQFTLRLMGFGMDQIRKESFTVEFIPHPPLLPDPGPRQIVIHFGDQTFQFQASYPKTILEAALDNKIDLPYSCKGGRCSTCVARCEQGSVLMSINEVLTEKDLKEGLVLTCVGYAKTDLELRF